MTNLSHHDLDTVTGGNFYSAGPELPTPTYEQTRTSGPSLEPPKQPGTQYLETARVGKSPYDQLEDVWNRSTRVMRTFNETFGWTTKRPGFGR